MTIGLNSFHFSVVDKLGFREPTYFRKSRVTLCNNVSCLLFVRNFSSFYYITVIYNFFSFFILPSLVYSWCPVAVTVLCLLAGESITRVYVLSHGFP